MIDKLRRAFSNTGLITSIIGDLAPVLKIEKALLKKSFKKFKQFAEEEPIDARALAMRFQRQVYIRHNIESINISQSRAIIEKGKNYSPRY